MNKIVKKETVIAGKKLILEAGELAERANIAVKASYGDTVLLVTVVSADPMPDIDFFPLTVNYEERLFASGRIKTSRFVKREGRPTDEATILKRLIDHAIRPLFPSDYMDEVQVVVTVLSLEEGMDPEVLSMIATSAALYASDIPWSGPMVTARVGLVKDQFVLNPTRDELHKESDLDLMVSFVGKDKKFLAMEAEVNILPEEKIIEAVNYARDNVDDLYKFIEDFAQEVNPGLKKYEYESQALGEELIKDVSDFALPKLKEIKSNKSVYTDTQALNRAKDDLFEELCVKFEGKYKKSDMTRVMEKLEKKALQHIILDENKRLDGRGIEDVRELSAKVKVLPRTHGSGLFTRGQTQVLTVATLGSPSLELLIQDIHGERSKRFIHYYKFPPYSVGETGRLGAANNREIGHGMIAERALRPVVPDQKEFPYMIILNSETLSSSGSSSMASTCGSTLALMDAGVPIKDMVAGIAVGLVVNDDLTQYKILTDLSGEEDGGGFMDFKMTGTRTGVTAIQVDIKLKGVPIDLLPKIMSQSKEARLKILDVMSAAISEPRKEVSEYAPKAFKMNIDPEKIGMVIGSGGKVIKEIQESTETEVAIEDDGTVIITGQDMANVEKASQMIFGIVKDIEVGEIYDGEVVEILDFGALVQILPGKIGLMHVSEIADSYVTKVEDFVKMGDIVKVKVIGVDRAHGKISLSKKALEPKNENSGQGLPERSPRPFNDRGHDRGHDDRKGGFRSHANRR